jgi:hypothetical protein
MATIPALEDDFVAVPPRKKPGLLRRAVRAALSAVAYVAASLLLLATAPVLLVMSDRADVVRWSNDLLDLVSRW